MADKNEAMGSYDLTQLSVITERQVKTDNKVSELEPTINNVKKYVTISDGAITIGSSDSDVKMRIDNDSTDLINVITNAILCSFNSETTKVKNLDILNNLKVWDYSFKHDADGNIFFGKD